MAKDSVSIKTVREQIVDHLRSEVLSGGYSGGDPLRESKLAERYGVSRGPIRDALLQLSKEGLLVASPNRGVRVRHKPSDKSHLIVAQLRRRLEGYCLKEIFNDISSDDLLEWEENLKAFKTACESGDMSAVVKHDMAFHRSIVDKADDEDLSAIWIPIITHMMLPYSRHKNLMESYEEHRLILEEICNKNLKGAVKALEQNIQ